MPAYLFSSLLRCGALAPPLWVGGRERLQGRLAPGLALQPLPCRLSPLRYHVTINSLKDLQPLGRTALPGLQVGP